LMKKINADETMKKQFDNRQTEIQMKKEYDMLKNRGLSYEKIGEILGKNSQLLLSQQKSSDEFGRAIEKIKDTFASFVENEDIENLIQSVSSLITNMSEFLMENAGFLGIRTPERVAKKYGETVISNSPSMGSIYSPNALRSYHLDIKKLLLSKDPSISENAAKDVAVMIRKYDKLNNIPSEDAKKLDKYIFDMIYKSSGKSTLPVMVEKFTKDFIDKNISELGSPITPNINLEKPPKSKFVKELNDGMISPQGNIVIKTPVGDILPNLKDYIITTTNPSALLSNNASQNITQYLIDETKMVSTMEMVKKAVEQQTIEIVKAFSQNRDVNLNGRKVGEMINMSNNRI